MTVLNSLLSVIVQKPSVEIASVTGGQFRRVSDVFETKTFVAWLPAVRRSFSSFRQFWQQLFELFDIIFLDPFDIVVNILDGMEDFSKDRVVEAALKPWNKQVCNGDSVLKTILGPVIIKQANESLAIPDESHDFQWKQWVFQDPISTIVPIQDQVELTDVVEGIVMVEGAQYQVQSTFLSV